MDRYISRGLSMMSFGLTLTIFSHWILTSTPLTALGVACVILGLTIAMTPSSPVPKDVVKAIMETSCINLEALLEEFNATEKAIFFPPENGRVRSFIPLKSNPEPVEFAEVVKAPTHLISEAGGRIGLIIFPPGSEIVKLTDIGEDSGIEETLKNVLVDRLEATKSLRTIKERSRIIVEFEEARINTDFPRFRKVLGSLIACIAATTLTALLRAPVTIIEEEIEGKRLRAVFNVVF